MADMRLGISGAGADEAGKWETASDHGVVATAAPTSAPPAEKWETATDHGAVPAPEPSPAEGWWGRAKDSAVEGAKKAWEIGNTHPIEALGGSTVGKEYDRAADALSEYGSRAVNKIFGEGTSAQLNKDFGTQADILRGAVKIPFGLVDAAMSPIGAAMTALGLGNTPLPPAVTKYVQPAVDAAFGTQMAKGAKENIQKAVQEPTSENIREAVTATGMAALPVYHAGKGAVDASKTFSTDVHKVNPEAAAVQVYKPSAADSSFTDKVRPTIADIKAFGENPNISNNEHVIQAARKTRDNLQKELQSWMDNAEQSGALVPLDSLASAAQSAIPLTDLLEDPTAARDLAQNMRKAYGGVKLSVPKARAMLVQLNAELNGFYDKNTGKRNAAVNAGSSEAMVKAKRDALAKVLYETLDPENAGAGPADIQARTGNVINFLDLAHQRRNAIAGEKPISKADAIGKTLYSIADLPGKALHGDVESAIGNVKDRFTGKSDAIIKRLFEGADNAADIQKPQTVAGVSATPPPPVVGAPKDALPGENVQEGEPLAAAPTAAPPGAQRLADYQKAIAYVRQQIVDGKLTPEQGREQLAQAAAALKNQATPPPITPEALTRMIALEKDPDKIAQLRAQAEALGGEHARAVRQQDLEDAFGEKSKARQAELESVFRAKPAVPENGTPEEVARGQAAREDIATRLGINWATASASERLAIDDLIAEGYTGAAGQLPEAGKRTQPPPAPPRTKPTVNKPAKPAAGPERVVAPLPPATPENAKAAGELVGNPPEEPIVPAANQVVAQAPPAAEPSSRSGQASPEGNPKIVNGRTNDPNVASPDVLFYPNSEGDVPAPGKSVWMATSDILRDPERFQYKSEGIGEGGVGNKLKGESKFDPEQAGDIQVWRDPADGKVYAVNGHHRHELATRLGAPEMKVTFLDAPTAEAARARGAILNMRDDNGTPLDVARLLRDGGFTPEMLTKEFGLRPKQKVVTLGMDLSKLSDALLNRVANEEITPERGALIGRMLGDKPVQQDGVLQLIKRAEDRGQKIDDATLENLIGIAQRRAPKRVVDKQIDMFGNDVRDESTLVDEAKLMSNIRKRIQNEKKIFGAIGKQDVADKVAKAGNSLNVGENAKIAQGAAAALDVYDRLRDKAGPIAKILDAAGEELSNGAQLKDIEERIYGQVRDAVLKELPNAELPQESGGRAEGSSVVEGSAAGGGEGSGLGIGPGSSDKQSGGSQNNGQAGLNQSRRQGGMPGFMRGLFGDRAAPKRVADMTLPEAIEAFKAFEKENPPEPKKKVGSAGTPSPVDAETQARAEEADRFRDWYKQATEGRGGINASMQSLPQSHWIDPSGKAIEVEEHEDFAKEKAKGAPGDPQTHLFNEGWVRTYGSNVSTENYEAAKGKAFDAAINKAAEAARNNPSWLGPNIYVELNNMGAVKVPVSDVGEFLADPLKYARRQKGRGGLNASMAEKPTVPTFYSKLGKVASDKLPEKGTPEQMRGILNNPLNGVKAAEIAETGVNEWLDQQKGPITRDQVQEYINAHTLELKERHYAEDEANTRFGEWASKGGKNYREILLKTPIRPGNRRQNNFYQESHWPGQPNVVAHIRADDRTGPNGEKILHLQEVQSDWRDAQRRQGAFDPDKNTPTTGLTDEQFVDKYLKVKQDSEGRYYYVIDHDTGDNEGNYDKGEPVSSGDRMDGFRRESAARLDALEWAKNNRFDLPSKGKVPRTPFYSNPHELALKRMLRYAAENGYDKMTWTPGEEQIKRYDLRKFIDKVTYDPEQKILEAYDHKGKLVMNEQDVEPDKIEDHIGKEPAAKLQEKIEDWKKPEDSTFPVKYDAEQGGWVIENPQGERLSNYPNPYTTGSHKGLRGEEVYPNSQRAEYAANKFAKAYDADNARASHPTISGLDLKVGGEGKKRLYDEMIPQFLNKYANKTNKWGAKVGETEINGPAHDLEYKGPSYDVNSLRALVEKNEAPLMGRTLGEHAAELFPGRDVSDLSEEEFRAVDDAQEQGWQAARALWPAETQDAAAEVIAGMEHGLSFEEAMKRDGTPELAKALGGEGGLVSSVGIPAHSIDITPEMKQSVLHEGQPMFQFKEKGTPRPPVGDLFGDETQQMSDEQRAAEEAAKQKLEADRLGAEFNSPLNATNRRKKLKAGPKPVQESMFGPPTEEPPQSGFDFKKDLKENAPKQDFSREFNSLEDIGKMAFKSLPARGKIPARIYIDEAGSYVVGAAAAALQNENPYAVSGLAMSREMGKDLADQIRSTNADAVGPEAHKRILELADAIEKAASENPRGAILVDGKTGQGIAAIRDTIRHESSHIEQNAVAGTGEKFTPLVDYANVEKNVPYYKQAAEALDRKYGYNKNRPDTIVKELLSIASERKYDEATGRNRIGMTQEQMRRMTKAILDQSVAIHGEKAYTLIRHGSNNFRKAVVQGLPIQPPSASSGNANGSITGSP